MSACEVKNVINNLVAINDMKCIRKDSSNGERISRKCGLVLCVFTHVFLFLAGYGYKIEKFHLTVYFADCKPSMCGL